ncbi:MAG: MFS transporter [Catenulispora sp.]|nr:MFS transporter [Catenulispora sp.]
MTRRGRDRMRALLADLGPLRDSEHFRRLWLGDALSSLGGAMTAFALVLQVYRMTGSSLQVGMIGLVQAGPTLAVVLSGGGLTDRFDRRRLTLATSGILAAVSALFAVQAFAGGAPLSALYGLAALQAGLWSIDGPARQAMIPRLVGVERVGAAVALNQLSGWTVGLVAPAVAGLIASAGGLRLCYVIDTVTFAAAVYGLFRLPAMPPAPRGRAEGRWEGFAFIRRSPVLAAALLADLDAMVLGVPTALFPAINAERFGGRPETLGLLGTAVALGGLLGSGLSGPAGRVRNPGRAMLVSVSLWGAGVAGFGLAPAFWPAFALLAAATAADTTTVVFRAVTVQAAVPEEIRGRVTTIDYLVGVVGVPLGKFRSGLVARLGSPTIGVVSGGAAVMIGALLIRWRFPAVTADDDGPSGRD